MGEVRDWEKVRRTGVLFGDFWEFWRTKAGGSKGDVCPDVAFHEEMPKINPQGVTLGWNNNPG